MKKNLNVFILVLVFFVISCTPSEKKQKIIGNWKLTDIQFLNTIMNDSIKTQMELQKKQKIALNVYLHFEDDEIVTETVQGQTRSAEYELKNDGTLNMNFGEKNGKHVMKLLEIDDNKMVLRMGPIDDMSKYIFTKQ